MHDSWEKVYSANDYNVINIIDIKKKFKDQVD